MESRENTEELAQLRVDYSHASLRKEDVSADPIEQFQSWMAEAQRAQLPEPNAMIVATAGSDGQPSARTLLLKGVDSNGFSFFTNYESRKAREMAENPRVSLHFLWKELERQVSIIGSVQKTSREESEAYFHSRPYASQIGALVSTQSAVIPDRDWLEEREHELRATYPEGEAVVPLPDFWGGYLVSPLTIEFWQGRRSRLHDRILYSRSDEEGGAWKRQRLSP